MEKKFKFCAVGGTFDRLHKGHVALLSTAFRVARRVVVGITSGAMVAREGKKLPRVVQPFKERFGEVENFLLRKKWLSRARLVKLEGFAGPAGRDPGIDCIAATTETRRAASSVNSLRKKRGFRRLKIVLCPFVRSSDNRHISSTRIRLGESNRLGKIYSREFGIKTRLLPKSLAIALKKPLGLLVCEGKESAAKKVAGLLKKAKPTKTIAVGDVALSNLAKAGVAIAVGFADLKTMRRKRFQTVRELGFRFQKLLVCRNPKSSVSRSLVIATKRAISSGKKTLVRVFGEEDLAVLPAVLFAPLGSVVIYGQPGRGLVVVRVGEEEKEKIASILGRFSKK